MGWNYELALDVGDRETAIQHLPPMADQLSANPLFGTISQLTVYKYELYRQSGGKLDMAIVQQYTAENLAPKPINHTVYGDFPNQYMGDDYCISATWRVERFIQLKGLALEKIDMPVTLNFFDPGYTGGYPAGGWHHPTGVIYRVGDYKDYLTRKEAGYRNLERLIPEVAVLADSNVRAIRGYDADVSPDMRKWSLIYYRDIRDYSRALQGMFEDLEFDVDDLTIEHVIKAAQASEDIRFIQPQEGVIVYSEYGTKGNLRAFFQSLQQTLSA